MMEKKHYARATAMLGLAGDASGILATMLAGGLLVLIGIRGIFMIDIMTFLVAIGTLVVVFVPEPERPTHGAQQANLLSDMLFGFRYIFASPTLLELQLVFSSNLIATFGFTVFAPMILARTGSDTLVVGSVQTALGIGGVVAGVAMSAWGGFKRRVHGVLLGMARSSLFGTVVLGVSQSLVSWIVGALSTSLFVPLINGSNRAIWQSKIPPGVQGRVFATRRLIAQISAPVAMLASGPLADRVFEPPMVSGSPAARAFATVVGSGPGSAMGLMLLIAGVLGTAVGFGGYAFRAVRDAETLLPDHDATPPGSPQSAG